MEKHLRPCIAEIVGTFFLVFIGAGVICTDAVLKSYNMAGPGLVGIAIAHGLALAIGVSATMYVSGGHLNPAVTFTLWVYQKIDNTQAILYVAAQLLGAVIAGGLIVLLFQGHTVAATEGHFGTPHINRAILGEGLQEWQVQAWAAAIETILTFLLVFAVFGTAIDPRAPKIGGFGIGLTIAADILVGGPLTGAAMNPARAFGPAIWEGGILGWDHMRDQLVYWIGPLVGGVLAGGLYLYYVMPPEEKPPAHAHAQHGKV
jgi:aquaporin Z